MSTVYIAQIICSRSLGESGLWPGLDKGKSPVFSPLCLEQSVNEQEMDQSSKSIFKRHLKNFNIVEFLLQNLQNRLYFLEQFKAY